MVTGIIGSGAVMIALAKFAASYHCILLYYIMETAYGNHGIFIANVPVYLVRKKKEK